MKFQVKEEVSVKKNNIYLTVVGCVQISFFLLVAACGFAIEHYLSPSSGWSLVIAGCFLIFYIFMLDKVNGRAVKILESLEQKE